MKDEIFGFEPKAPCPHCGKEVPYGTMLGKTVFVCDCEASQFPSLVNSASNKIHPCYQDGTLELPGSAEKPSSNHQTTKEHPGQWPTDDEAYEAMRLSLRGRAGFYGKGDRQLYEWGWDDAVKWLRERMGAK